MEKFYPRYYYTPMPEMHNENIPVTRGYSYNKCLYCDLNDTYRFEIFSKDQILSYIRERADFYKNKRFQPKKFTLLEGNALCLPTGDLLDILSEIQRYFPDRKYVSTFSRSQDILHKSDHELHSLKEAGLNRISIGIESGSDRLLSFHRKGVSSAQQKKALLRLEKQDISYSTYLMLGLGGKEFSDEHADQTANFLRSVQPFELTVVTLVLFKNAPLIKKIRQKKFHRLSIYESLIEEHRFLNQLQNHCIFNGTHKTNAYALKGKLPEQKQFLLNKLYQIISCSDPKTLSLQNMKKWHRWEKES